VLIEPSMNWPDEIFQATEQAHRLVYGTGLVPWEFQLHVRSWLLPGAIAGLMEAARLFGDGPDVYLPVIAGTFALLGTAPVICCFLWCKRLFGLTGAVVGSVVVATMPDLVYFGARTLTEVVAGNILIIAIYLLDSAPQGLSRRQAFIGGALLGLVCVLRIQIAPAASLIGLFTLFRHQRPIRAHLIGGGMFVFGCAALFDTLTLGAPLASLWRTVLYNIGYGVSSTFGVSPWYYYFHLELYIWHVALAALAFLAMRGARHVPQFLWAALVILAAHSAIAHKEIRFIYPAMLLISVVAGIGMADVLTRGLARLRMAGRSGTAIEAGCAALLSLCWLSVSLYVWTGPGMTLLRSLNSDALAASSFVEHGPAPCGIGMMMNKTTYSWERSGGYTFIHRSAPIYWFRDEAALADNVAAFDTLIYPVTLPQGHGFTPVRCFGEVCVARREGICRPAPEMPLELPHVIRDLASHRAIETAALPAAP
jgi:hypothetical protein